MHGVMLSRFMEAAGSFAGLVVIVSLAGTPAACGEPAEQAMVGRIEGDSRPFAVVSAVRSADRSELTVTFRSERGIFAFQFHPPAPDVRVVRFVMEKQKRCEGLTFSSPSGKSVELIGMKGVNVRREGEHLSIQITGAALEIVKSGGRIQYVNEHR
jgi:hypothetical protein